MIIDNTPIETYPVDGIDIYVKREDLCVQRPGPPFSKMRGLFAYLSTLKQRGISTVGYTESSISMAGWGVAWLAQKLDMTAVIYDPQYSESNKKDHLSVLEYHRQQWKAAGAEIRPIKAGMVKVNYNICSKLLQQEFPGAIMLPLGLPLQETVDATAAIAAEYDGHFSSVVVCIGSGTICAGLVKGMRRCEIYGIMSRSGNESIKHQSIIKKAGVLNGGLLGRGAFLDCIDLGMEYTEKCDVEIPFPCHSYYDAKAWKWLTQNIQRIMKPILFWNIGSN